MQPSKRRSRSQRLGLAVAALCALALAACARKAPGPAECRSFALAVAGVRTSRDLERSARLRSEADELTRQCLTPYDREMLRCVEETGRFRACRVRFELRRVER
jgi:hypothetical protein